MTEVRHADITYINVAGTFYYLCLVLDGYSRYIVHCELRESMKETDVEIVLQRARERFPGVTARLITDNGPQFVARDFCNFIRLCGMTHVRTSPYYPRSSQAAARGRSRCWPGADFCVRNSTPTPVRFPLVGRDKCSLDLFWLKDESLLDADNLPDPDEIAEEIADDLRSALEQIEEILGDLGPSSDG